MIEEAHPKATRWVVEFAPAGWPDGVPFPGAASFESLQDAKNFVSYALTSGRAIKPPVQAH